MNQSDDSDSRAKVDGEGLPWWCRGPDCLLSVQRRVASIPRQGTKIPLVPTKKKKKRRWMGGVLQSHLCRGKNFGVIGAVRQRAGMPLEGGMFIGLRLENPLLARPYGDTRNSWVGWEIGSLCGSQTQLLLDLQAETPQALVKVMPAQCGLEFASLAASLTRNHKFFAGTQYHAETALHAS